MTTLPAKEAVVIVLDGNTTRLESAVKAVNMLVQQKMLYASKDEVGLVLFGTRSTQNQLAEIGYKHITTSRDIDVPDLAFLRTIERLGPGGSEGDFIDALIVAMDLLIRKAGKYQRRIFLVTDAGASANANDMPKVTRQFQEWEVRLNVIGIDFDEEGTVPKPGKPLTKIAGERLLHRFAKEVEGVVALEMMSYLRSKSVLQRTAFRGFIEIGENLKIGVWSFLKTMEAKFPSLSKVSVVSQQSANPRDMTVKLERSYVSVQDPDMEVAPEDRLKAYRYGKSLVPFNAADEAFLTYSAPERQLVVLGFTHVSNVPRHHFMGQAECIVPVPHDAEGATALSALIHALAETDSVAIVRYVKRAKSVPHLGCLVPYIKAEMECLYYHHLPFAEDIRQYAFAPISLENIKKAYAPSKEQLEAADALIDSLDLMTAAKDDDDQPMEALKPKCTYNPVLQHFYQAVQKRALQPEAPIPPLDSVIQKYLNPDANMFQRAKPALEGFAAAFPLTRTEVGAKDKGQRRFWRDTLAAAGDINLESYGADAKKSKRDGEPNFNMDMIISSGVSEVGSVRPAQDFKNMLSRRDIDLVEKAIDEMRIRIQQLVSDSLRDQLYGKAIECLQALRNGCVQESEPNAFNIFLRELRAAHENKRRHDFWALIVEKHITLIHDEECDESDVGREEAAAFLTGPAPELPAASGTPSKKAASNSELENLIDQIE